MGDIPHDWKYHMRHFWMRFENTILKAFVVVGLIGVVIIVSGCASFNTPYTVPPQVKYACTFVHWIEEEDIQAFCPPNAKACATVGSGSRVNHIWTTKPQAFDDRDAVYRLGHEFLHTLGARHK